jgi:hypothetical protein
MTTVEAAASNPFALMMDPESVFAAIARSERLGRLHSRIWRPLDKPLVAHAPVAEAAAFDGADEPNEADAADAS